MKINIGRENLLLHDLRNFNEIFKEDVAYDNIKSHHKARFHPLSKEEKGWNTTINILTKVIRLTERSSEEQQGNFH